MRSKQHDETKEHLTEKERERRQIAEFEEMRYTVLRILQAVAVLHDRGYHSVRIMPGLNSSGIYWRVSIASIEEPHKEVAGAPDSHFWGDEAVQYSTMALTTFLHTRVDRHTTPDQVADLILAALPNLTPDAADSAYADWYKGLLRLLEPGGNSEHLVPVAFEDWFAAGDGWRVGNQYYPWPPGGSRW